MTITLRPDQERVFVALQAALRQGARRPLIQAPTAWGKGTFAAYVLARFAARDEKAAFVCHREEINLDLVNRIRAAGVPSVRVIMGDHTDGSDDAAVTVASVQTLDARDVHLPAVRVWWWDEAHRAAAASYVRAKERHPDAYHFGSTATPARADGRPLTFFDTIIQGPQVQELVGIGALAPVTVFAPDEALEGLADRPEDRWPDDRPGVVFASNREHGRALRVLFRRRGIRAEYVDGDTPARSSLISSFNEGGCDVLICYRLLSEGVDLPRASVVMFAGRVGSTVTYLQGIGRGRRVHASKTGCIVLDLCGSLWLHGHPDADRRYSLDADGPAIRLASADLLSCVQCPGCLAWGAASTECQACGHMRPPPRPPRISKAELREQRLERQPRAGSDWELWSSLVRTQRARGYKPQWAAIQFMQQTRGRKPRWGLKQVPEGAGQ